MTEREGALAEMLRRLIDAVEAQGYGSNEQMRCCEEAEVLLWGLTLVGIKE